MAVLAAVFVSAACSAPAPTPTPSISAPASPTPIATPTPSLPPTAPRVPTQAEVLGAIASWMPTFPYFELPRTLYVLTGASDFQIGGSDSRQPAMLTEESRQAITDAFGADHKVVFVDDPTPLIPSPYPDVSVGWDWGDGGALIGFSMDPSEPVSTGPGVWVAVNNGNRGAYVAVTVADYGSGWKVVNIGQPAQWIT